MKINTITILGCGALGLFYGSKLTFSDAQVKFLLRSDYDYVKENEISVKSVNGDYNIKVNACKMPEECKDSDLILVCLKTTANDYMLKTLPKLIGPNSVVMTLQNGLGNEEEISKVISADKIIGGVAFICVNRISAGKIDHSAFGHVKANGFNKNFAPEKLRAVKELFEQSGLDFSIEENLHELKWEKLVWNVPFNGLSASLGGVDTRSILAHQPTHAVAIELMKEVILGAKTQDVILDNKLIDENINKTLKMGPYMTSMSIDRLNKKPLEVEGIIGIPLRKAKDKGIKLPYMENLYAELSYYNASLIK